MDGAGTCYISVGSVAATSNGWSMIEGSYTHSPSGAVEDLIVYVEADSASARFYVDDLAMTGTIVPPPLPPSGADITVDTTKPTVTARPFGVRPTTKLCGMSPWIPYCSRCTHQSMEVNWNAYIWWWARRYYSFLGDGDAQFGTTRGEILKRGWAFSHYAKFVRPGYLRVDAQKSAKANGLEVTAFQGDNQIVLVILNRQNSAVNDLVLAIPPHIEAAQFYSTSRFRNREPMDVSYDGQKATVDVGARSISTVVLEY